MADCLKRNLPVQDPVYCKDSSGDIIPELAMYSWMSVRAAGPNVLKDTTLCGTTTIEQPVLPQNCIMEVYLPPANIIQQRAGTFLGSWWRTGEDFLGNNRTWGLSWEYTPENETYQIFGPPSLMGIANVGLPAISNITNKNIICRVTLTATVVAETVTAAPLLADIGLRISSALDRGEPSPATQQKSTMRIGGGSGVGDEQNITCDMICILQPSEWVYPVWTSGPNDVFTWYDCTLIARFIEYTELTALPGGNIYPPPPPT